MSASYRDATSLLPLSGAKVHVLTPGNSGPAFRMMGIWVATMVLAGLLPLLVEPFVPPQQVPLLSFLSLPIVIGGLVTAFAYYRRAMRGGNWRLHHAGERVVLERVTPPLAVDVDDARLALGTYTYSTKYGRFAVPTLIVSISGVDPILLTGPQGITRRTKGLLPGEQKSKSPTLRVEDYELFTQLQRRAQAS